jgi:phosphomannomutase
VRRVYIFDVDGTLTPSRRTMTEDFLEFFNGWTKRNSFWLVSGSDLDKMKEQVPEYILERAEGIFTCGGNQMWREGSSRQWPTNWELKYENKFIPDNTLLTYLGDQVRMSETPVIATNHIEDRGSMLNFSVVGRDCTLEERKKYFEWDKQVSERERIAQEIKDGWPELDAVIGGQISIDIAPIGNDKSQVIGKIMGYQSNREYIFIGDRTMKGGNDYPLAKVMKEMDDCEVYQAGEPSAEDGYKRTKEILEELND